MTTRVDVKINNSYEHIETVDPDNDDNQAAGFFGGETWLNTTSGDSFQLTTPETGVWTQIEENDDAKIDRVLRPTFFRLFKATGGYFYRRRQTSLTTDELADGLELDRFSFQDLVAHRSAFAEWTVTTAPEVMTADSADDVSGEITDIDVGDTIVIRDSARNDQLYTVTARTTTAITVTETLTADVDKFLVIPIYPTTDFDQLVGRMIWFDIFERNKLAGLASERVGTYSYTQIDINGVGYPIDVAGGFDQYMNRAPMGTADRVS